jgi:hypothetical protein
MRKIKKGDETMNRNCYTNDYNNNNNNRCQETCESRVINPTTLSECSNHCYPPYGCPGPLVAKIPVVLANCKIQVDVEADIRLDRPAYDIKTLDKKVCITQCHLVPHTNKLFIEGFVTKNIQYSTVDCTPNNTSLSGAIRHTTADVPFKCVTEICFEKMPVLGKSFKERSNVLDECMMCPDNGEDSWIHFNKYYEPVFCELEWSKILESDIYDRCKNDLQPYSYDKLFQRFTEKMVIYLGIKVLQNQQVYIPEPDCPIDPPKDWDSYEEE